MYDFRLTNCALEAIESSALFCKQASCLWVVPMGSTLDYVLRNYQLLDSRRRFPKTLCITFR